MGKTRSPDQVLALKRELTVAAMRGVSPMPQRDSCLGLRVRACMAQETLERSQSQERNCLCLSVRPAEPEITNMCLDPFYYQLMQRTNLKPQKKF